MDVHGSGKQSGDLARRRVSLLLAMVGLTALLAVAFWLRWRFLTTANLHVDEFTTIFAATRVQEYGYPSMPSGVLYTRGLLSSYVEALFLALLGQGYTVARLPSLLFGLGAIAAVFVAGRREWHGYVGWLAAMGLVLLPEAVEWGGRARFYAQWQFFALLAVWTGFLSVVDSAGDDRRTAQRQWLFAAVFVMAVFSQEATLLLYPSLLLAAVLWRGWRFLLRRHVLAAQVTCVLAIGLRFAVEIGGQPGYFETIQAQRPYVGLIFDLRGAWATYGPLLAAPLRLPLTLLALLAGGVALWQLASHRWRLLALPRFHQATLYFALQFVAVLTLVLTVVGTTWRESRYLFLVQPLWLLIAAAGAACLILLTSNRWLQRSLFAGFVLALAVAWWRPAVDTPGRQIEEGYQVALAYLASARQAGDVVLSPQPPACALVVGDCDFYAVQNGYEEYVILRDGVPIDRWSGARLMNTTAQLQETIRTAPRTWFVTDGFRLATRYDADFVRTVVEQFDVAFDEEGVMVLRADGWRDPPAPSRAAQLQPPAPFPPLALTGWERTNAEPGKPLHATLFWQGLDKVSQQINTSLQLVAATGARLAQADGPPARGMVPTPLIFDRPVPDPKTLLLPDDLPPSRYRLEVSAYDLATLSPLADPAPIDWFLVGPPPPSPAQAIGASFGGELALEGMDVYSSTVRAGDELSLRLVWSALTAPAHDYTVFVHLTGPDGTVAQDDHAPEHGFYPTSAWQPGERVVGSYTLTIPANATPGEYRLMTGLYRPDTGERLRLASGDDALELGPVVIGE